jgi:N,N'-diacetyllegionaminate synthase
MNRIIIIAEIGVNHNGNLNTAMKLIDLACKAKVDFVKFQSFISEDLVTSNSELANYQRKNFTGSQNDLLKKYELNFKDQTKLYNYCKKKKIGFLSTPFDHKSLDFIKTKVPFIKISSGDLDNIPFLKKIAKTKKKILLSTGMSNSLEISRALKELVKNGVDKKKITLMHCHTDYPTKFKDINLKSILYLKKKFRINVGFSDHTVGIESPIAAVALGAKVIEKHFTISKKMKGPDHSSSIDFKELVQMVKSIRNIELGMGKFGKFISSIEKKNKTIVRKSIVASTFIKKGSIFNEKNLITKRPGNGISAIYWNDILGKRAKKNFLKDEKIKI